MQVIALAQLCTARSSRSPVVSARTATEPGRTQLAAERPDRLALGVRRRQTKQDHLAGASADDNGLFVDEVEAARLPQRHRTTERKGRHGDVHARRGAPAERHVRDGDLLECVANQGARRLPLGENRTSSVRPNTASASRTSPGASKLIWVARSSEVAGGGASRDPDPLRGAGGRSRRARSVRADRRRSVLAEPQAPRLRLLRTRADRGRGRDAQPHRDRRGHRHDVPCALQFGAFAGATRPRLRRRRDRCRRDSLRRDRPASSAAPRHRGRGDADRIAPQRAGCPGSVAVRRR